MATLHFSLAREAREDLNPPSYSLAKTDKPRANFRAPCLEGRSQHPQEHPSTQT